MKELKDLSKDELLQLSIQYNNYIIETCDDEQNIINKYPVCMEEYLNNEFCENNNKEECKLLKDFDFLSSTIRERLINIINDKGCVEYLEGLDKYEEQNFLFDTYIEFIQGAKKGYNQGYKDGEKAFRKDTFTVIK